MIPVRWMVAGAVGVALVVGVPILIGRYNESLREDGRAEVREEMRQVAEEQTARNRELQRAAELRYTVVAETRDRFITKTVKEVHYAAAPLAACPVPDAVRLRINAASACARDDSGAACAADDGVPAAR